MDSDGRYSCGSAVGVGSLSETKHGLIELSILRARCRLSVGNLYYLFYTATVIFIPNFYSFTGKIQEFLSGFVHPHHQSFFTELDLVSIVVIESLSLV